jgi:predicted helicase
MDKESVYGKVIYNYSTRRAISDKQLVDYTITAPFINNNKYTELIEHKYININNTAENIRLFLISCLIVNTYIEKNIKHLLIFNNTNKTAERIMELIDYLLKQQEEKEIIFTKFLSGNDNMSKRKLQVKLFSKASRGIISSARIFGEGVNIPICDSVCFADTKSSTIDIIQYVGRCLRLCKEKPNKISNILVPFVIDDVNDFSDNKKDSYFQLRNILKSLGTTDEIVSEKFVLQNCNKIVSGKKSTISEKINVEKYGESIDFKEFKNSIINKIFDKTGEPETRIRNKIIYENKRRLTNNLELIDTKKKCLEFLKKEKETVVPTTNNWVKNCLGNDWFDELKKKYYYNKNDLKEALLKLQIIDFEDYKVRYSNDCKLPSPEYIDNGFYFDTDNKTYLFSLIEADFVNYDI